MTEPSQQGLRTVGAWALGSHIGAGSFAIVWRARHVHTGQEAAVKEIALSKLNAKLRQSLESEVAILKRIRHENIVQLLEVIEEADRLYLVMEYCAGGDLAHLLRAVKRLPEAAAQHLMRQLAAGLRQMWAHHLVHRDLKPQNLLLSEASADATLKIADFGFARNLQPQGLAETLCGSPLYMAPEILHFHNYDAKADLWSIGAILYELVVGRPPFTGANQFQLLRNIERSEARLPEALAAQLSPQCRHLIHCLLRRNPVERLSFEEFFRHPFVATPEEAAAPLPPRTPFGSAAASLVAAAVAAAAGGLGGGSTRLAQLGAAAAAAPGQQRTLLFSTSAPAVAAALGPKSRSSGSIPQQVLGFQQASQPRDGGLAAGAAAAPASQGSPAAAAVRLGGLSHQLKPRRSLDLDGAAAQQAAAQHPLQQRQEQQLRPQPVAGRRLGSIQRVQGFQPAAPLPGQPQQAHWAPAQRGPSSVAAQLRSQQPPAGAGASAASQAAAALLPGGRPASQQSAGRPSAAAALAAAGHAAQGHSAAGHSVHSEDDDYVLVDPSLSAHTAPGGRSGSTRAVSPQGPSRSASAEGSLAGSRHAYASAEEDVFAVHPSGEAHTAAAALPPAWLGAPRWRFLQRTAHVLRHAASSRQAAAAATGDGQAGQHAALRECLSLHLAALQLLEHALEGHAAAAAAAAAAEVQPSPAGSAEDAESGAAADLAAAEAKLQADAAASMEAVEEAAAALDKAGQEPSPTAVTPAAAAVAAAEAALPDPWELLYGAALAWGREAAVDELLGNQARSCRLYARAGTALSFLCSEAPGLDMEPPAELAPADRARLQKYAAATAARWAACAAAAASADSGQGPAADPACGLV